MNLEEEFYFCPKFLTMLIPVLLMLLGFGLLILGADWLVKGASTLAKKYKISDLAIGLTIVSFGTSAPELVVNLFAAIKGYPDIVLGNVIGSNNFNVFVILGITGIITPLVIQSKLLWRDIPISFLAILFVFVLANDFMLPWSPVISRGDGLVLLAMFGLFLFLIYRQMKQDSPGGPAIEQSMPVWKMWGLILLGLAGLITAGHMVVSNAIIMAKALGMSEKVIGLTIVAAGTSLPELATSLMAAIRKKSDIAVGNIIGSNIFNIFLVLGLCAVIQPLEYHRIFNTELILLIFGTLVLFIAMFTFKRKILDRWEAGFLLMIYLVYTVYLVQSGI